MCIRDSYYGDTVSIDAYIKEYNGIKLTVGYEVKDDRTGMVHCRGTSKHCFIDKTGRPLVLRKMCIRDRWENVLKYRKSICEK